MTVLLVAAGGALGAATRYVTAHYLDRDRHWGTVLVNVVGSFLLGWLVARGLSGSERALLAVGFCGGLTTWSALAVQSHDLGLRRGTSNLVTTLVLGIAACVVGFVLGA